MSKCRIQWSVEWLGQKNHTYIGFRNNRHLASTGEHTVKALIERSLTVLTGVDSTDDRSARFTGNGKGVSGAVTQSASIHRFITCCRALDWSCQNHGLKKMVFKVTSSQ